MIKIQKKSLIFQSILFHYINKVICSHRFASIRLYYRIINRNSHQFRWKKINQHKGKIQVYTHTLGRIKSRWFLIENGEKSEIRRRVFQLSTWSIFTIINLALSPFAKSHSGINRRIFNLSKKYNHSAIQ